MQTTNYVVVFAKIKADNSDIPSPPPPSQPHISPSALVFFTIAVVVFCFVGFSVVFFCRCCFVHIIHTQNSTTLVHLSPNNVASSPTTGLDPSLLQAFPTFLYSTVKDLCKEKKYSLECAICLLEFDNDSMLRLLTICYHVFHQECIDLWLHSHKTCPVCRTDLETQTNEMQKPPELDEENVEEERRSDHVCIDVKEGDGDERHDGGDDDVAISMNTRSMFARSHSTGHSVVMVRGGGEGRDGDDKYTLRLPEHMTLKIVRGGHNYSKSCSSYKDMARLNAPCSNCGYVQTVFDNSSCSDGTKTI